MSLVVYTGSITIFYTQVNLSYVCPSCSLPLCGTECPRAPYHRLLSLSSLPCAIRNHSVPHHFHPHQLPKKFCVVYFQHIYVTYIWNCSTYNFHKTLVFYLSCTKYSFYLILIDLLRHVDDIGMIPLQMGSQGSSLLHQLVAQLTIGIWAISSENSLAVGPTVRSVQGVEDIMHAWSLVLLDQLLQHLVSLQVNLQLHQLHWFVA